MEYKMSAAAWVGRRHQELGVPCQDCFALERSEDARVCCAALADGAGSRTRSELGAACVTRCVSRLLCGEFDALWETEDLAGYLVRRCVQALALEEPPVYELASTLLFFAGHSDGRWIAGHLGDGVQIHVGDDGALSVFSPPENGAYQNETFFLTAPDAAEHLRLRRGRSEGPGSLLLMSDGMSESLYQYATGTPAPACRKVAQWLRDGDEEAVSQALEQNMKQVFSLRTGDDLSLAAVCWE
ncbi:MAG: protein phosphatase 2C domain-containing protein [Oscillibacter sp.]|nr:protein phosphatase 2C domain-containing protein [Oscillibacter sp.]